MDENTSLLMGKRIKKLAITANMIGANSSEGIIMRFTFLYILIEEWVSLLVLATYKLVLGMVLRNWWVWEFGKKALAILYLHRS